MKSFIKFLLFFVTCTTILGFYSFKDISKDYFPVAYAVKQDLKVEIKVVGELEAAHSLSIASAIKGDQGKIIELISDGVYVQPGHILIKMDPTPFEEKREKLLGKIKEQEITILALDHALEWEISQAEHKNRTAEFERETAALELEKIIYGDGPQEISRLKGAMQKAWQKYDELDGYSNDLLALEEQGFINTTEIKQAQKKLAEEKEAFEMAKLQYESYVEHVHPMQVKKGETGLKRALVWREEVLKSGEYGIAKARAALGQANQCLNDYLLQLQEAEKEIAQSEIKAPASGMVVHREDYRNGQKRKPRVGDILIKNQPLIDLPDLSSMVVKTRVREVDLHKIDIGKKATIEIDAYPELVFQGTISSIGVLALSDLGRTSDEKYFEVRIALDSSDSHLRPGMTTRATIHAQEVSDALTIPLQAVFEEVKQAYCYLAQSKTGHPIKLGMSNEHWVEVKEGLEEGSCILLVNPN